MRSLATLSASFLLAPASLFAGDGADSPLAAPFTAEAGGRPIDLADREEEFERLMEKEQAAHPEFAELQKKLEEAEEAQAPFGASHGNRGFVWVFLRK